MKCGSKLVTVRNCLLLRLHPHDSISQQAAQGGRQWVSTNRLLPYAELGEKREVQFVCIAGW